MASERSPGRQGRVRPVRQMGAGVTRDILERPDRAGARARRENGLFAPPTVSIRLGTEMGRISTAS